MLNYFTYHLQAYYLGLLGAFRLPDVLGSNIGGQPRGSGQVAALLTRRYCWGLVLAEMVLARRKNL